MGLKKYQILIYLTKFKEILWMNKKYTLVFEDFIVTTFYFFAISIILDINFTKHLFFWVSICFTDDNLINNIWDNKNTTKDQMLNQSLINRSKKAYLIHSIACSAVL